MFLPSLNKYVRSILCLYVPIIKWLWQRYWILPPIVSFLIINLLEIPPLKQPIVPNCVVLLRGPSVLRQRSRMPRTEEAGAEGPRQKHCLRWKCQTMKVGVMEDHGPFDFLGYWNVHIICIYIYIYTYNDRLLCQKKRHQHCQKEVSLSTYWITHNSNHIIYHITVVYAIYRDGMVVARKHGFGMETS